MVIGELEFEYSADKSEQALYDKWHNERRAAGIVGRGHHSWPHISGFRTSAASRQILSRLLAAVVTDSSGFPPGRAGGNYCWSQRQPLARWIPAALSSLSSQWSASSP